MNLKYIDIDLLIKSDKIRYQSDFSSAHWLHQVISIYEQGIANPLRRDAFEKVLRAAINAGCKAALDLAKTYPDIAGFPSYIYIKQTKKQETNWNKVSWSILKEHDQHVINRFSYLKDGD